MTGTYSARRAAAGSRGGLVGRGRHDGYVYMLVGF